MKKIALAVVVAVAALLAAVGLATAAPTRTQTTHVRVLMGYPSTFAFTLSTKNVAKGTVVFALANRGKIAHDFEINGKKSKLYQPGQKGSLTVVFRKAGRYRYKCTVPGHAALGMKGVLTVR